jgi:hypothetical protein
MIPHYFAYFQVDGVNQAAGVSYYVNSWVVGIGAPLPGTKTTALPGMLLMLMDSE